MIIKTNLIKGVYQDSLSASSTNSTFNRHTGDKPLCTWAYDLVRLNNNKPFNLAIFFTKLFHHHLHRCIMDINQQQQPYYYGQTQPAQQSIGGLLGTIPTSGNGLFGGSHLTIFQYKAASPSFIFKSTSSQSYSATTTEIGSNSSSSSSSSSSSRGRSSISIIETR
ncbi:hypothetical protein ACTFIW_009319 [Dictyostelium discoideum]